MKQLIGASFYLIYNLINSSEAVPQTYLSRYILNVITTFSHFWVAPYFK